MTCHLPEEDIADANPPKEEDAEAPEPAEADAEEDVNVWSWLIGWL